MLNQQEFEKLKAILSVGNSTPQTPQSKSFLQKALPVGGMILGGIGGAAITKSPGGAITGAGLGGAAGEAISQKIGGEDLSGTEILKAGVGGSISELAGQGAVGIGGPLLSKAVKWAGKKMQPLKDIAKAGWQGLKKVLPGISDDTAKTIAKSPDKVESLASQQTLPVNYIVDDVQEAASKFEAKLGTDYEKGWAKLMARGENYSYNKSEPINSINKFLEGEAKKGNLFFKFGKKGKLDFSSSPFTKSQQQNVIQKVVDEINTASPKNIAEIRALKQRLNAIYKEYSNQFGANPQLNRLVTNMVHAVDDALPEALKKLSKQYSEGLSFLNTVDELLLPTSSVTGELKASTISKIKSMGKEEIRELYGDFLNEFKKKTGYDLEEALDIYNAAKEINPNLIPQDTGGFLRGIQRAANPLIGAIRIKQAQGLVPKGDDVLKVIQEKYQGFQPVIDFIKDNTIEPTIKAGIFESLRELFDSTKNG